MNKRFILLSCFMLCFLPQCKSIIRKEDIHIQSQQIKASVLPEPVKIFTPSYAPLPQPERLVYKAKFLGFSIGQFILINNGKMILNDRETYHFELIVKTLPFFAKLFKTKDRYVSYMDAREFTIVRHEEYVKGGSLLESVVDFDYKNHTAFCKNFITSKETKVSIPNQLLDVLSGGFYLRMVPWQLGDTIELKIYADEKIYDFIGLYHSQKEINISNHGKQQTDVFKPYLFLNDKRIEKISAEVFFSKTVPRKTMRAVLTTVLGNVAVVLE